MNDRTTSGQPFITLENATLRIRDRWILPGTNWRIETGQHWAVIGPNGAGKTTLARALIGDIPVVQGSIRRHLPDGRQPWAGYVSFELHRAVIAREESRDHARYFSGDFSDQITAGQMIRAAVPETAVNGNVFDRVVGGLKIVHLLDRAIRCLSTGEMRKVLIARALAAEPRLLVLDEPFDGLDEAARLGLGESIRSMLDGRVQLILITHRTREIFPEISHVIRLGDGGVLAQGPRHLLRPAAGTRTADGRHPAHRSPIRHVPVGCRSAAPVPDILVAMKNVRVRYGRTWVLRDLNWTVRRGENWAVVGPNGSGKTTLLHLIGSELPQAYANDICLFGRRRGTGESIWEIRRHIGLVGAASHIYYRRSISAFAVVLSGFFDSVGLYRTASPDQRATARSWMRALDIKALADRPFDRLSYGQQRMVLIARAVVKSPLLLLLDEPCQGLDGRYRKIVRDIIDFIGTYTRSHLVYVTHHEAAMVSAIDHVLRLPPPSASGGSQ